MSIAWILAFSCVPFQFQMFYNVLLKLHFFVGRCCCRQPGLSNKKTWRFGRKVFSGHISNARVCLSQNFHVFFPHFYKQLIRLVAKEVEFMGNYFHCQNAFVYDFHIPISKWKKNHTKTTTMQTCLLNRFLHVDIIQWPIATE